VPFQNRTRTHDNIRPKLHSTQFNYHFITSIFIFNGKFKADFWEQKLQNSPHNGFSFSVPFSLAGVRVQFRAENNAIHQLTALLRANQIAWISYDF